MGDTLHPPMADKTLRVLAEAAKRELYRVPLLRPAAIVWTCSLGTVNLMANAVAKRGYIERHATIVWLPRLEPRYRLRAVGPVEVYRLTAPGWAAARRQLTSRETHELLGPVPS